MTPKLLFIPQQLPKAIVVVIVTMHQFGKIAQYPCSMGMFVHVQCISGVFSLIDMYSTS